MVDGCLTDDHCGNGHLCVRSDHTPNSARVNANSCVPANCRVDADCRGGSGYCVPTSNSCGVSGYYCHTAADSCVNAAVDCPSSCFAACAYFPDRGGFGCIAPFTGGR